MQHSGEPLRSSPGTSRALPWFGVAELPPRAGIVTSWFNSPSAELSDCPILAGENPFNGSATGLRAWSSPRQQLRMALPDLLAVATGPARCVLPVPGDTQGLPPESVMAVAAGQAMVVPIGAAAVVIVPTSLAGRDAAVWQAQRVSVSIPASVSIRDARLEVLELTTEAVELLSSAPAPARDESALARRLAALEDLPLPPGTSGRTAALVSSSARLLAIVAAAAVSADPGTSSGRLLLTAMAPLAAAGRRGLATALSQPGPDSRDAAQPT
jgi:hypothetical protein